MGKPVFCLNSISFETLPHSRVQSHERVRFKSKQQRHATRAFCFRLLVASSIFSLFHTVCGFQLLGTLHLDGPMRKIPCSSVPNKFPILTPSHSLHILPAHKVNFFNLNGHQKYAVARQAQLVSGMDSNDNIAKVVYVTLYRAISKVIRKFLRTLARVDVQLVVYFALWFLGNYYHNITGKKALVMTGGAAGFPVTIATMQMGIGCLYSLFLWAAPDARKFPSINLSDVVKMIPVAFCNAGVHGFSSFATSAGAVSFGQMVKASEPVFAAVLGTTVYGNTISTARWLCLIPIIGGVCLASVSELNFAWLAFWSASIANVFAAFKGNENAKLMKSGEIRDKLETVGNQFAVTTLVSFLVLLPVMVIKEGSKWGQFIEAMQSSPVLFVNFVMSGLLLYGYNECATMTIKKTSAMTQSVANTAKRAVVIIGSAMVFGESLGFVKLLGCAIALIGVLLYSVVDTLLHRAMRENKSREAEQAFKLLDSEPKDCLEALRCMSQCMGAACEKCKNIMCGVENE